MQNDIKISVLIPIFNYDVTLLVLKLLKEMENELFRKHIEIILIDDCSTNIHTKETNRSLIYKYGYKYSIRYYELQKNIGRSAIRNLLVSYSGGEYLLFLDADVLPDSNEFLKSYWMYADAGEWDVLCGGISYLTRLNCGKKYDFYIYFFGCMGSKSAAERNRSPWKQMLTSNVMIRRSSFLDTPFDERFIGYGYEDNEWGIRLMQKYRVLHIDNTASHLGIQTKEEIYEKMRESIQGYFLLASTHSEVFKKTRIAKLVQLLQFFPITFLIGLDKLIKRLYDTVKINALLGILLQFNKALLLAIYQKEDQF